MTQYRDGIWPKKPLRQVDISLFSSSHHIFALCFQMKTLRKRFNRFAQKLCMSDRFAAFWKCKNLRILALFVITAQLVLMESQDDFYEEVSNFFCCINGFHIYALLASPGKMLHGAERLSVRWRSVPYYDKNCSAC